VAALFVLIGHLLEAYSLICLVRILLSWFPNIEWYQQPYRFLHEITEPYLSAFRFIPPIGMLDISPVVAMLALAALQRMSFGIAAGLM